MKKLYSLVFFANGLLPTVYCTNWLVGPSHTYTMPSQVASLVGNGDTVSIDAGTYTADVCKWNANNLLLRGVGGMAHLDANNTSYGQKGIWVIAGNNTRVEYIEFSHCHDVPGFDMNWAGIRQEGLNLTVSHCYFHDNDNGILAGTFNPSKMVIEYTEFDHNGYGDGYSHNLYINHLDTLIFRYNYSHHATVGHELKSRAHVNYILYNRFSNEATGDASREIDLPDGGLAIVMGNIIEQGPNSQNSGIVGYALESSTNNAPHNLYFINNTVVNDKSNGTFVMVGSGTNIYKAYNNIFAGAGTIFSGTPATLDTMNNWRVMNIANCGFMNAAGYDYQLNGGSGAIDAGINAGTANNGYSLTPILEYSHPASSVSRPIFFAIDIGAHEFTALGISDNQNDLLFSFHVSHKTLNLSYDSDKHASFRIVDLNGRSLLTGDVQKGKSQVDISNFEAGIYIIEILSEGKRKSGIFFLSDI